MATAEVQEEIDHLKLERTMIRATLLKTTPYKSNEAQGSSGAKTEYTDPIKLHARLAYINTRLKSFNALERM